MNELKRTLRDMDANLRRVNQELRKARRRASELGKFRLREPQRTIARILMAMHHGEPTAAMDYIQSKRKGKQGVGPHHGRPSRSRAAGVVERIR